MECSIFWNRSLMNFWLWFQSLLLSVWCHMHICVLVCSYVLEFDDDEEDGSLPQRVVPFHKVVALPEGHRQWIFFFLVFINVKLVCSAVKTTPSRPPMFFFLNLMMYSVSNPFFSLAKLLNFLSMLIGVNTSEESAYQFSAFEKITTLEF